VYGGHACACAAREESSKSEDEYVIDALRMCRWPLLALILVLAAGCEGPDGEASPKPTPDGDDGPSWSDVSAAGGGAIRVLYVPAQGFAWREEAKPERARLDGLTVDLMRDFADWVKEAHGLRLRLEFEAEQDWGRFYERVRDGSGGLFGLGNVTITEARREELAFSPPYMNNVAVLITHEDVPELESIGELGEAFSGLRPLAFGGTLHETRLQAIQMEHGLGEGMALASSNEEIVEAVAGGGYFAYIDAYNYWRAGQAGLPLRRHAVGDDPGEAFGIIMPRDSDWRPVIEEWFEARDGLIGGPLHRRLLEEHLGGEVARILLDQDD
jgi:putative glutamine transport system substrate-binding protein